MAKFGRKICSKTEVVELCVFRNISVVTEKGFKLLISHSDIHLLSWCDVMSSCDHVALMALVNLQIQSRTSEACTMKQDLRAQRVNFRFNPEFSGLKMWFIHIGGEGEICAADFTCSTARYVQNRKRDQQVRLPTGQSHGFLFQVNVLITTLINPELAYRLFQLTWSMLE